MKWATIGLGVAGAGLVIASAMAGCAEGEDPVFGNAGKGGAAGQEGGLGGQAGGQPTGGNGGTSQGGAGGSSTGGSAGSSAGGSGGTGGTSAGGSGGTSAGGSGGTSAGGSSGHAGEGGGGGSCKASGTWASVDDVATSKVAAGTTVWIEGAIATTRKLVVYSSKNTGTCLWGVFVKAPTQPYGTMVVSYGDNMTTLADGGAGTCPDTGSDIPNGIMPGDVLDITGDTDAYAPSTCTAPTPAKQIQVKACSVVKTGGGGAPAPVEVSNPADLKTGDPKYQGLLVRITNVTAQNFDGGTVGPYGVITLQGSGLEVHDKFYYTTDGAPEFGPAQHFNSIVGINHLDYCTWALQPRDKCKDLDPKSIGCP
ncbi:MAG: hypothetical protein HY898_07390 [Deltaproteobacteria bacterium]|nr:hypothetical protein [Deltaproteobacteria bacterium]